MTDVRIERRNLPKPIPERIREAREARGLTPDAFAELLDITKQAVAQYESGLIAPSGEVMGRIIAVTRQPPSFFVTSRSRSANGISPFWRGLKRMELHHRKRIARRLEWASDIVAYVGRFIHLPEVSLPTIDFEPATDPLEKIEDIAELVRDAWSLGRGPVGDIAAMMELHGIIMVQESVACPDMDAVSCWQGGRPYVLFSTEVESGPRNTFNVAHELGHVLLHSAVEVTSENLKEIEKQANRFASAFLLPRERFSREVLGTSIGHFKLLKESWGVSIAAMAYRCKDLEIFNDNQLGYVMKQMNMMKIKLKEPLDELFQVRKPSILAASIKMLIDNGVQTKSQIEEALNLNMADVESLAGVEPGYLNSRVVQFTPRAISQK